MDNFELRNKIGSISVMNDGRVTDDNIAIALATYFEGLPECPEDDINDEVGWSQWAIDKTNDVLDRIVEKLSNQQGVSDEKTEIPPRSSNQNPT